MMLTNRAKILFGTIGVVVVIGALGAGQYENTTQIVKLENQKPITVTKTIIVTPTIEPTATPSAVRIFTPAKAVNSVTKGAK